MAEGLGSVKLKIGYTFPKNAAKSAGKLVIGVLEARNLSHLDNYVKIYIVEKGEEVKASKQKTAVIKGTPHPAFSEEIKYTLPFPRNELNIHRVSISVWSSGLTSHFAGGFSISLEELASKEGEFTAWFDLLDESTARSRYSIVDEPMVVGISSAKKGKKDDDTASITSTGTLKKEKKEKEKEKEKEKDKEKEKAKEKEKERDAVSERADIASPPPAQASLNPKSLLPAFLHLESRYDRPSAGEKNGGTVVLDLVELRRDATASASVKSVLVKDGKENNATRQKSAVAKTSGRSKSIAFNDTLAHALPSGPVDHTTRVYLTVHDSRDKCIGAMSFSARDIKDGNATGWFQLITEADGRAFFHAVSDETAAGEAEDQPSDGEAPQGDEQEDDEQDASSRFGRVGRQPDPRSHHDDDDDDAPSTSNFGGRVARGQSTRRDDDEAGTNTVSTIGAHHDDDDDDDDDAPRSNFGGRAGGAGAASAGAGAASAGAGAGAGAGKGRGHTSHDDDDDDAPSTSNFGGRVSKQPSRPADSEDSHTDDEPAAPPPPTTRGGRAAAAVPPPPPGPASSSASAPPPPPPPGGAVKRGSAVPPPPPPTAAARRDGAATDSQTSSPAPARAAARNGSVKPSDSLSSLTSIASSNIRGARSVSGALQLDIEYVAPANRAREGLVTVKVARASGLKANQPYVKLFTTLNDPENKSPRQATVPKNGSDPIFNQHFTFKLPARQPMDDRSHLHVVVWDHARAVSTECLGSMAFPFDEIESAGKLSGWYRLLAYAEGKTRFEALRDPSQADRRGQDDDEEHEDTAALHAEIEDLRQQLDDAHAELDELRRANAELQRNSSSRGNQSQSHAEESQALRKQLQEIFEEKETAETRVRELEEHSTELESQLTHAREEADRSTHDLSSLQQRLADKIEENDTLRSFVDRLSQELLKVDSKGLARAALLGAPMGGSAAAKGSPRRR